MNDSRESSIDRILALYREGVDITLLRENLKLSVAERMEKFERFMKDIQEIQGSAKEGDRRRTEAPEV